MNKCLRRCPKSSKDITALRMSIPKVRKTVPLIHCNYHVCNKRHDKVSVAEVSPPPNSDNEEGIRENRQKRLRLDLGNSKKRGRRGADFW